MRVVFALMASLVIVVSIGAQPVVDPNLFPTADNPIYIKVAALETAITGIKTLIQQAIALAPRNTKGTVMAKLREAVALAEKTEEQWWRWGRPRSVSPVV